MNPQSKSGQAAGDDALDTAVLQAEYNDLKEQFEALQADYTALEEKCQEMEEAPDRLKDLAARAQADLQNAKARLEEEGKRSRKFALESFFESLLPTLDNLKRAFDHIPEELADHEWMSGMQAIEQEFIRLLETEGLNTIDALGETVDSSKHDVLMAGSGDKDIVVEVFEPGYQFHEKTLRPAKVKVGDGTKEA